MPDLLHSLLKQDLGHLRVIAELWGLELQSSGAEAAREELAVSLLDPGLLGELIESLAPEAGAAITELVRSGGRIPWPMFARKYGEIREAGAGRRDREKLYLQPSSPTEILYYRGLIGRAFFDTRKGPQEFAYIPDDVLSLLDGEEAAADDAGEEPERAEPLGRAASPGEKGREVPADDSILDDATTLLAALRLGIEAPGLRVPVSVLHGLLEAADLVQGNTPRPEPVKEFLEEPRPAALERLQSAWLASDTFNELRLMPSIVCEGEWNNNPQETREFLLTLLEAIPEGKWWSLGALVRDIRQKYPDFQRPAGDYDSWFIRRAADGQYLRGFGAWDQVDGALIRFFITSLLHWLGQVDLSFAEGATEPASFQVTDLSARETIVENRKLNVSSQGLISVPRLAPRGMRYQVARFSEWEESKDDVYRYRLSTRSLTKAREQGLKIEHLLALLTRHSEAGPPPSLVRALRRWETHGTEARVQTQVILRLSRPEVLDELRRSKAARFVGEALSPTSVVIRGGAIQKVREALTELGLLSEISDD